VGIEATEDLLEDFEQALRGGCAVAAARIGWRIGRSSATLQRLPSRSNLHRRVSSPMSASECTTTAAAPAAAAAASSAPTVSASGAAAAAHEASWRTPLELTLLGAIWGGAVLFI